MEPVNPNSAKLKPQGFDEFFRQHYRLVYRAAYRVTHSREDAEDVVQIVFMNILRRGDTSEFAGNVEGYLYRAGINRALHILRVRKRQTSGDDLDSLESLASPGRSIHEDRMHDALLTAMTKLKPEHVEMLVLYYEHGYRDDVIAGMLGCSRVKVAVTLFRARAQLKKIMAEMNQPVASRRAKSINAQLSTEGELR